MDDTVENPEHYKRLRKKYLNKARAWTVCRIAGIIIALLGTIGFVKEIKEHANMPPAAESTNKNYTLECLLAGAAGFALTGISDYKLKKVPEQYTAEVLYGGKE